MFPTSAPKRQTRTRPALAKGRRSTNWRGASRSCRSGERHPPLRHGAPWLIFADRAGLGARLAEQLTAEGIHATLVFAGEGFSTTWDGNLLLNPGEPQQFEALWNSACGDGRGLAPSVAYLWSLDSTALSERPQGRSGVISHAHVTSALHLVQALAKGRSAGSRLWVVTQSAIDVGSDAGPSPVAPMQTMLWGFGRTIALEHHELWGGLVDVRADVDAKDLVRELLAGSGEDEIALRDGRRFVARLERRDLSAGRPADAAVGLPAVRLDPSGTFLVTGGLGAIGLRVAAAIAKGARKIVLTTRRDAVTPRPTAP